jgi:exonuclease III
MNIAKTASINFNGVSAHTRVWMHIDFIRSHDLDIVFLQEVTIPATLNTTGYATHLNIGATMRGKAIQARLDFPLTNVTRLPSGRITTEFVMLMSTYRLVRPEGLKGTFFNSELPELFYAASRSMLM